MQSSNPVLRRNPFVPSGSVYGTMTVQGTVAKTAVLLVLALITGSVTWILARKGAPVWSFVGVAGTWALLFGITLLFKPQWSPVLAPLYAMMEGVTVGGASFGFEQKYPGIVVAAAGASASTLAALLFAYQSGLIRATGLFKQVVRIATWGIALFAITQIALLFFFNVGLFLEVHGSGLIGIGFSVFVAVIAALNLVIDFDRIEEWARVGAPEYFEWYSAFSLMITLLWLYFEILRLLTKLSKRR
ncbi:MAG: Bax inhibitor-1/YccA family protein [Limisphaerales bacterium]